MVPDADSCKKELKGKHAVQTFVTSLLRKEAAQGESMLTAKMAALQGEPTSWAHQKGKPHIYRETHQEQAEETEDGPTIPQEHVPNAQQLADLAREEEETQLQEMLRQQDDEEVLLQLQEEDEHLIQHLA
ncbi:hypothetical protein CYMTET_47564 [Cymbomonas tetramitiformis]|uniref:Uncharacterized protein n=1 Tax=Cymbomonas tetramitiformis TaxID=36881 RepID=A0AAE0BTW0_9CHLO|nr:hypothetical protein CYMTET_47564 [Cymbomonas tetramitiformis]